MSYEALKFEIESLSNQVKYLFFKLDDLMKRLKEIEERVSALEGSALEAKQG